MSLLSSLFERRASLSDSEWVKILSAGNATASGVHITPESALTFSAYFGAIRILAESTAMLPLLIYRRLKPRGKERAYDHPLYSVLHDIANPEMDAYILRETLTAHVAGWGNAYAEIESDSRGNITALWPLRPDIVTPKRNAEAGNALGYEVRIEGKPAQWLPAERVLHLRGLSPNGISGYSVAKLAAQDLGLALAATEFGARFFGNDARPSVILKHPAALKGEAAKNLKASFEAAFGGLSNKFRVAVLEEGMTLDTVGIPPEDAQFLQTRSFQVEEIARWFRIPASMLAQSGASSTYASVEAFGIQFVTHTLTPWLTRWEKAISTQLLQKSERPIYFAEHVTNALVRGDIDTRYRAYSTGRQWGWLSVNDVREMENMNPVNNGDEYLTPLNMVPAGTQPTPETPTAARAAVTWTHGGGMVLDVEERGKRSANTRHRMQQAQVIVYRDTLARILRRESQDVNSAARRLMGQRTVGEFFDWLTDFYRNDHRDFVKRAMRPINEAYAQVVAAETWDELGTPASADAEDGQRNWVAAYTDTYAGRHAGLSEKRLREAVIRAQEEGTDPVDAVRETTADWETARAENFAREESVRLNNAMSYFVYLAAGVQLIVWRAFGESCPYCRSLNGRRVGISQTFIMEGEAFQPEGADAPLTVTHAIKHAPAHAGCDCIVTAG